MPTLLQRVRTAWALARSPDLQSLSKRLQGLFPVAQPPTRGTKELLDLYRTSPWLRAVCSRISGGVSSVPWRVYVVTGTTGKAVRHRALQRADKESRGRLLAELKRTGRLRELTDHPLLSMLDSANPVMTGRTAMHVTQTYLDVKGETFWLLERNDFGMPVRFWPLPPHWVLDVPSVNRPVFSVSFPMWQGDIPAADIIWLKDSALLNPYGRGVGYAEALGDELDTDEYASKHLKAWFYNRARPDLLVSVEGANQPELEAAKTRWENENRGVLKAFRAHFVNRPMQVTQLGQTFQDQQMVPLREFMRNTAMQVFGVPPEVLGVLDSSNRSTIDAADFLMAKHVTVPRLEFLRTEMQEQLVPMYDERIFIDYVDPTPGDKEFALNVAKSAPWTLTVDEFRELMGRPPEEQNGGVRMRPVNVVPYILGETIAMSAGPVTPDQPPDKPKGFGLADIETVVRATKLKHLEDAVGLVVPGVKRFHEETLQALRLSLTEGAQDGESSPQLVKRVSRVFADAKGRRADTLAHDEARGNEPNAELAAERKLLNAIKRGLQQQEHDIIRGLNALREGGD